MNSNASYQGLFNITTGNFDNISAYNASFTNTFLLGTTTTELTPSQAVVTNGTGVLTTLQYTPNNVALTLVSRDASGNVVFNQVTCSFLVLLGTLILYGLRITPQSDNTSVFSVTNAADTTTLFNIDTTNMLTTFKGLVFFDGLGATNPDQWLWTNSSNQNLLIVDPVHSNVIFPRLTASSLAQFDSSNNLFGSNTVNQNIIFNDNVNINGLLTAAGGFTSYDIQDTSSGNLTFHNGFTAYDNSSVNLLALSGSGSTVYVVGTNANPKFAVYNSTSVRYFSVSTTTGQVSTINNGLDDGSGNSSFQGNMRIISTNNANKFTVYQNTGPIAFNVNTTTGSVTTLNNTLDDGSGNMIVGNNLTVNGNLILDGVIETDLTASAIVQTNASSQLAASNTLAQNLTLSGTNTLSGNNTVTGTVTMNGTNNSSKFIVQNSTGSVALLVNTSTLSSSTGFQTLDDGSGNMTVFKNLTVGSGTGTGTFSQSGSGTFSTGTGAVSLNGTTGISGTSASQLVQTNSSNKITSSNTLPSGCSATNLALTTASGTFGNSAVTFGPSNNQTIITEGALQCNVSTGNGSWGTVTIQGIGNSGPANLLHLVNNGTGACGPSIFFVGNTGSAAITAILQFLGVNFTVNEPFAPSTNNALTLGTSSLAWSTIYGVNGNYSGSFDSPSLTDSGTALTINNATTCNAALSVTNTITATPSGYSAVILQGQTWNSTAGSGMTSQGFYFNFYLGTGWVTNASIVPAVNGSGNIGSSSFKWNTIYATTGTINTSDRNEKEAIKDIDHDCLSIVNDLKPSEYTWKNKQIKGTHFGLIAQDIEETMDKFNIPNYEGLVEKPQNAGDSYGVNYANLIPFLVGSIQQLTAQVQVLQTQVAALHANL